VAVEPVGWDSVRLAAVLVMTVAVAILAAACGSTRLSSPPSTPAPSSIALTHYPGFPPGTETAANGRPPDSVFWAAEGQIAIVTWGSSGCPGLPTHLQANIAQNAVSVTITEWIPDPTAACTTGLAPTTSVLQLPASLDLEVPLIVKIVDGSYGSTVTLSPSVTPSPT